MGDGSFGQLGSGNKNLFSPKFIKVTKRVENTKFVDIACGQRNSVAVSNTGSVFCWGYSVDGRLLLDIKTNEMSDKAKIFSPTEIRLAKVTFVKCFSGGDSTFLATDTGEIYSGGVEVNVGREVKRGNNVRPRIVNLEGCEKVVALSSGRSNHTILKIEHKEEGSMMLGFGNNNSFQLGFNGKKAFRYPRQLKGLQGKRIISFAAGGAFSMFVVREGAEDENVEAQDYNSETPDSEQEEFEAFVL